MDNTETTSSTTETKEENNLYYFGYGPIVNDLVRKRRGIVVEEAKAAYLEDYRLTFAIGGLANIVARRGWEVHGVLMKLASPKDWDLIASFDAGSTPTWHSVVPYKYEDPTERREGDPRRLQSPIRARLVEFSGEVEDEFLESPIEVLPQCRYLELIAKGMSQYGVDEDYIDCQIMATPFTPKRSPDDYQAVPLDCHFLASRLSMNNVLSQKLKKPMSQQPRRLPRISYEKYLKLCQKQPEEGGDVFFLIDQHVYRIAQPDTVKVPAVKWIRANGHGKPDISLIVHKLIVDNDIPICDELRQLTPLHFDWVQDHIVEQLIEKYQCVCTRVALLKTTKADIGDSSTKPASSSLRTAFKARVNDLVRGGSSSSSPKQRFRLVKKMAKAG